MLKNLQQKSLFVSIQDDATDHHPVPLLQNLGTLTSQNPLRPSGPVTGLLYLSVSYGGREKDSNSTPGSLSCSLALSGNSVVTVLVSVL